MTISQDYLQSQTEDPELQLMVPGFVAELWVSPIVACRLCLGRIWRQPGFTVCRWKLFFAKPYIG